MELSGASFRRFLTVMGSREPLVPLIPGYMPPCVSHTPVYASLSHFVGGYTSPYASRMSPVCLPYCLVLSHATLLTVLGGMGAPESPLYPFHCWLVIPAPGLPFTRFTVGQEREAMRRIEPFLLPWVR